MRDKLFFFDHTFSSRFLNEEIRNSIKNFEPRVLIEFLEIIPDFEKNQYNVNLTYSVINLFSPISITFFLKRAR